MTDDTDEDPRRQFSDEDLIETVREHEPAGTQEIADAIGATRRAVEYRLRSLADDETSDVQAKKIGRTLVWYIDR
jgi:predicted ArsR family transcriptional regulator